MSNQDLVKAKEAVESILNALNLARVVYVDDYNITAPTVEDTIAAALPLDSTVLQLLFPELGDPPPDDPDILSKRIREVWKTFNSDLKIDRGKAVIEAARQRDGDETGDLAYIEALEQIIPKERLVSLSPAEWNSRQNQLLVDSQTDRTLFVFDRDLSGAGGDTESGIKIIASLLARNDTETVLCGLLTHTVEPATQPEQWAELSDAHGIPMDRFVVIPKRHLSEAPMLFAQMLKYAALAPEFTELKGKAKDIICRAADVAADKVDQVRIHDIDHMVFRVSAKEGLWEPEMLFRLHALFHRLEARRLAHEGGDLEKLAERLRVVSGIPTDCGDCDPPSSAWLLQKQELYEQDEHINRYHLPIEVGDIFERQRADSLKRYVLLAQPCDLMVRSDGERHPELRRVPLVEICATPERPQYAEEMPCFGQSLSEHWYVKLRMVHYVRPCILDLCVFNQDGTAMLPIDGSAPSGLRPSWKARFSVLEKEFGRNVCKADLLAPSSSDSPGMKRAKEHLGEKLGSLFFDDDVFKGKLVSQDDVRSVKYDCRRVGRISRARAMGLLLSYTGTLGRPAYDRPLV